MDKEKFTAASNLTTPYRPVAIYYDESDIVEYIREDVPAVYSRIDDLLTLIFDMRQRDKAIGFSLKGFRNFYIHNAPKNVDFISLVGLLERKLTDIGNETFEVERRVAYGTACEMALTDSVSLRVPVAASR